MTLACNHVYCSNCHAKESNECPECQQKADTRYANQLLLSEHSKHLCEEHRLSQDAYCEKCEKPICAACLQKCALQGHEWVPKNHYIDAIKSKRQAIDDSLGSLRKLTDSSHEIAVDT